VSRNLFGNQWDSFERIVLAGMPDTVKPLFKRAFYGGGAVVLGLIKHLEKDDTITDEAFGVIMTALDKEVSRDITELCKEAANPPSEPSRIILDH
jgi:hypothetical protein